MIRGMHAMFYSSEAEALRRFIRDTLQLPANDVGEGWLIFDPPSADLGVHPTDATGPPSGTAEVSFWCDDIAGTVGDLRGRGVEEILAADHQVHAVAEVVDHDAQRVAPVTAPIADEQIAGRRHRA